MRNDWGGELGDSEGQQFGSDQKSTAGQDPGRQIGQSTEIKRLSEEREGTEEQLEKQVRYYAAKPF